MNYTSAFIYKLYRYQTRSQQTAQSSGFTLLELLVAMFLASAIVTVLLLTTNELIASDQRESAQTETQRNMQNALDFMGAELREAVYVYEQDCLTGADDSECPGFFSTAGKINESLPAPEGAPGATRTPILTFWLQEALSDELLQECVNSPNSATLSEQRVNCEHGHAYSLIVYAYSEDTSGNLWDEDSSAGILRYEMSPSLTDSENYVPPFDPGSGGVKFQQWDNTADDPDTEDIDESKGVFGAPEVLVGFVDSIENPNITGTCESLGGGYNNTDIKDAENPQDGVYACVNQNANADYGNQNVVVYLRGRAQTGASQLQQSQTFLPSLEARVFGRGVLGRQATTAEE